MHAKSSFKSYKIMHVQIQDFKIFKINAFVKIQNDKNEHASIKLRHRKSLPPCSITFTKMPPLYAIAVSEHSIYKQVEDVILFQ